MGVSVGPCVSVAVAATVGVSVELGTGVLVVVGGATSGVLEQAIPPGKASKANTRTNFLNRNKKSPPREIEFADRSDPNLNSLASPSAWIGIRPTLFYLQRATVSMQNSGWFPSRTPWNVGIHVSRLVRIGPELGEPKPCIGQDSGHWSFLIPKILAFSTILADRNCLAPCLGFGLQSLFEIGRVCLMRGLVC